MAAKKVRKVFISSTYVDLQDYRRAAIEAVETYDELKPVAMEYFMSQPEEPSQVCDKEIQESDFFVGIYAYRYGHIPDGEKTSITHAEYQLAKKLEKPCLCFIVDEDYPWPPKLIESGKVRKLKSFIKVVKKEQVCSFFKTKADLKATLANSLHKLLRSLEDGDAEAGESEKDARHEHIPLPPAPYIAHPYPLAEYFTGRNAERANLSNWFFNEDEPLMVMEAIGGMGKSALSWVWLQRDVIEHSATVEGIFWWSFYDAPFDSFIGDLSFYILGRDLRKDEQLSDRMGRMFAALQAKNFLLVLDGFERALRGYGGMEAMYIQEKGLKKDKKAEGEWDRKLREPVHPAAARFLQHLCTGKSKTLLTTRLFPAPLEELAGIKHERLRGLSHGDAADFLRNQGVKGTRAELEQAAEVYDFHPLMLKHLASAIKRSRTKDIAQAFKHKIIDKKEPQKILNQSFGLLNQQEKQIATSAAVFRSFFTFEAAQALFPDLGEDELWNMLQELRNLGFLFYDEQQQRFDFHPIMRSFLYAHLTAALEVHNLAVVYFKALHEPEKVVSLEDLEPVIEHYHHLMKAGQYGDALLLYRDRLAIPIYFQLSAYQLEIELLGELFPDGLDKLPRLENKTAQSWTVNDLANSYSLSGQPAKAVSLYLMGSEIDEKNNNETDLAIGLGNVAYMAQLPRCRLSASNVHLHKRIALCQRIKVEFYESIGHTNLGRVLAYQGKTKQSQGSNPNGPKPVIAEEELNKSKAYFEKSNNNQGLSLVYAYRSLSMFLQSRLNALLNKKASQSARQCGEAFTCAHKALYYAEETVKQQYPVPRDFIRTYYFIGESLIQCALSPNTPALKNSAIALYDTHFQNQTDEIQVKKGHELLAAERCLTEALRRCRSINMVDRESDILLALPRLEWAQAKTKGTAVDPAIPPPLEPKLKEAFEIRQRSGYRIKLADIHLFCAQVLLKLPSGQKLLDLNTAQHLEKAKEYSLDQSTFEDLFKSRDPHFYDGIAEYERLKRGLTHEEKIEHGYWFGYKMAEALEKQLKNK